MSVSNTQERSNRGVPSLGRASKLALSIMLIGLLPACAVTTEPFSMTERASLVAAEQERLYVDQEPISAPLSLPHAMARALSYNLEHRIQLMEEALSKGQFELGKYDLLPDLVANAGYNHRSNVNGSSSYSIESGFESLEPSTSQDRRRGEVDLSMTWNVLDFGVSYYTNKQEHDRTLIAEENRRKVVHNLLQQGRSSFWRAVGAQMVSQDVDQVLSLARQALADSRQAEQERLQSPLKTLRYQRNLMTVIQQLEAIEHEMVLARTVLAELINIPPGTKFELALPQIGLDSFPTLDLSLEEMELMALNQRPEFGEGLYGVRVAQVESRKAMLRMLPGLELSTGGYHDDNSFLYNNSWGQAGARGSWNLFNLLSGPDSLEQTENQEQLAEMRCQALAMAITTQIHISYQQYQSQLNQAQRAGELAQVDMRIRDYMGNTSRNDARGKLESIQSSVRSVMSRLKHYQAYASAQQAVGQIYVTLGLDPMPDQVADDSLDGIAEVIQQRMNAWERGEFEELAAIAEYFDLPPTASSVGQTEALAVAEPVLAAEVEVESSIESVAGDEPGEVAPAVAQAEAPLATPVAAPVTAIVSTKGFIVLVLGDTATTTAVLMRANEHDFLVYGDGPYANAVSLGVYRGWQDASRRQQAMGRLGIDALVVDRAKPLAQQI